MLGFLLQYTIYNFISYTVSRNNFNYFSTESFITPLISVNVSSFIYPLVITSFVIVLNNCLYPCTLIYSFINKLEYLSSRIIISIIVWYFRFNYMLKKCCYPALVTGSYQKVGCRYHKVFKKYAMVAIKMPVIGNNFWKLRSIFISL